MERRLSVHQRLQFINQSIDWLIACAKQRGIECLNIEDYHKILDMENIPNHYQFEQANQLLQLIDMNDSDLSAEIIDQLYLWNTAAFGPGKRTKGVLDHIRKELVEIEQDPDDLEKWIDVILLAVNGAQRLGYSGQQIIEKLLYKIGKNAHRTWPDWTTADPEKAIEHKGN